MAGTVHATGFDVAAHGGCRFHCRPVHQTITTPAQPQATTGKFGKAVAQVGFRQHAQAGHQQVGIRFATGKQLLLQRAQLVTKMVGPEGLQRQELLQRAAVIAPQAIRETAEQ